MARIAILERSDMNAEQARVYDAAKQSSGIVGGPYYAYIRLPKLFEACQNLRASLSSGPLSAREQQIVNLVVARHWNARYPWFAQVRRSLAVGIEPAVIDAITAQGNPSLADAREHTCLVVARSIITMKPLALSDIKKTDFDRERSMLEDAISRVETEATTKQVATEMSAGAPVQPSDIAPTPMAPLPSVGSWLKGVFRRIWRD